jgi:hypothetical protein
MKKPFQLPLSPQLEALARGFARYHGQRLEEYILDALLSSVQADSEASHERDTPEAAARGRHRGRGV